MPTAPSKPGLLIALGVGKPAPRPPQSVRGSFGASSSAPSSPSPSAQPPEQPDAGAKSSRQQAQFRTMEKMCGACTNWTRETGDCSKVEGQMRAGDGCEVYFEDAGGSAATGTEPDADDMQYQEAPLAI